MIFVLHLSMHCPCIKLVLGMMLIYLYIVNSVKNTKSNLMKKNFTLVLMSVMLLIFANVQAQHHYGEWAKHFVGHGTSAFNNIIYDGQDIIAVGHYIGNDIEFEDLNLPVILGGHTVLLKFDTNGNNVWHTTIAGDGWDFVYDMDIDSENNIVVAGVVTTHGPLEINGEEVFTPDMDWTGRSLVAKFSGEDGSLLWHRIVEPTEQYTDVNGTRMTIDDNDNIYIGGYHNASFEFEGIEFEYQEDYYSLPLFVLKLDSDGDAQWGKSFPYSATVSGGGFVTPRSMVYVDDHVYFGFEYSKPLEMDDITLPYSGQYYWLALAKIDVSNGDVVDVKSFGSVGGQGLTLMEVDNSGDIVVAGWFTDEAGISIDDITLDGYGFENGFVIKFNTDMDVLWARDLGTESISRAFNIKIADDNRIFVGGGFHALTSLKYNGEEVLEPDGLGSLAMFEIVIDEDANLIKAYALYGNEEWAMVEYRDGVLLPDDVVFVAGATLYSVNLTETQSVDSEHGQGFLLRWDLGSGDEVQLYEVTFLVEDQNGNALDNAVITFHGDTYDAGVYNFAELEAGIYEYTVSHEGFFSESGQVVIEDEDIVHTVVLNIDDTSIDRLSGDLIQIFPNPASSHINIRSAGNINEIILTDVRGVVVNRIVVGSENIHIDISHIPAGIYLLRITGADYVKTQKIQINR